MRLFALAGDVVAPLQYLQTQGRAGNENEVRSWFAVVPTDQSLLLEPAPQDRPAARQLAEASKLLKERRLACWVQAQNTTKGIAPTSGAILQQGGTDVAQGRHRQSKYRWLRRFMTRWGGRRALFSRGERLPQEEFRQKASFASLSSASAKVLI